MTMKSSRFTLIAIAAVLAPLALFISCVSSPGTSKSTTLAGAYKDHFPIGAAVAAGEFDFDSFTHYPAHLLAEFNSLTAENAMKPSIIQPKEGEFNWVHADRIVEYAEEHNMRLRGHTLVWHNQVAEWMFPGSGTQEEHRKKAMDSLREHTDAVMSRYARKVTSWDVVNEVVADSPGDSPYRTDSPWYKAYGGIGYVREAFEMARAADPDALLFYNDYSMVDSGKRKRVLDMFEELGLLRDGLIDGVGMQAHWVLSYPDRNQLNEAVRDFREAGLRVEITELDIVCDEWDQDILADRYEALFTWLRELSDDIDGVTFWGIADDHTWLTDFHGFTNYPFLFDTEGNRKEAYDRVIQAAQ
uniref:Family 10 xylanase n=1 Tax=uncultured microorganism TaxID=358574 RepID=D5KQI4_9ZZZZ|nr:family 10 xylanase [uncultured microorganism]